VTPEADYTDAYETEAFDADRVRDDSAPADDTPAVLNVHRANTVEVLLDRCFVDGRNPRRDAALENVDELAASVRAVGLLQPLVGVDLGSLGVGVLGGRRRLAALLKLQAEGAWGKTVPVVLRADDGDLTTVAVAEQVQRVALTAAQEARAFGRLLEDARAKLHPRAVASDDLTLSRTQAVTQIAKAFGVSARHVEQRLTIASLHPPVLDALDKGELDLDVAKAYARADAVLQAKVWEKEGPKAQAFAVKRALAKTTLDATDPLAVFVTEAAYLAAGGRVVTDFFDDAEAGAWADRVLAVRLADAKLADEKVRVEAEGWSFVQVLKHEPRGDDWTRTHGKKRAATDAEQQTLKDIAARQKAIDAEEKAIYAAADQLRDGTLTAEEQTRINAFEAENDRLSDQADAIEESLQEWDAKAKAKAGALVFVGDTGALKVWRGVREKRQPTASHTGSSRAPAAAKAEEPDVTRDTRDALATHAAGLVAHALAAHPQTALAWLAADLAASVFDDSVETYNVVDVNDAVDRPFKTTLDAARDVERARWRDALKPLWKKPGAVERALAGWSLDELVKLTAFCVGEHYDVQFGWNPGAQRIAEYTARVRVLTQGLGVTDPGAAWTPTLEVLKGFPEKVLRGFCAELGVEARAKAGKPELAALVADHAAPQKWVPPLVRDLVGATWTPPTGARAAAAETAPKKRGRPSNAENAARAAAGEAPPLAKKQRVAKKKAVAS